MDCYRDKEYWEGRFRKEACYEWFGGYETFKHILKPKLGSEDKILILGCGSSRLGFDLCDDGFRRITNLDYTEDFIAECAKQYFKSYPSIRWICADIRKMDRVPSESYDVVIEKATLDSLTVSETDPWNMSESTKNELKSVLSNISRILASDGKFISITFAQPHFRIPLYANLEFQWSVEFERFGKGFHYFFCTMEKGKQLQMEKLESCLYPVRCKMRSSQLPAVPLEESDDPEFIFGIQSDLF